MRILHWWYHVFYVYVCIHVIIIGVNNRGTHRNFDFSLHCNIHYFCKKYKKISSKIKKLNINYLLKNKDFKNHKFTKFQLCPWLFSFEISAARRCLGSQNVQTSDPSNLRLYKRLYKTLFLVQFCDCAKRLYIININMFG